jgi:hypothetical protein
MVVAKRVEAGATEKVEPMEESGASEHSNVVDLTALLTQSLGKKTATQKAAKSTAKKGRQVRSQQQSSPFASAPSSTQFHPDGRVVARIFQPAYFAVHPG